MGSGSLPVLTRKIRYLLSWRRRDGHEVLEEAGQELNVADSGVRNPRSIKGSDTVGPGSGRTEAVCFDDHNILSSPLVTNGE
ncbi:hypothetical protein H920_11548 [Fukomys damarensis]|uniref:Uncharacterized protein n=1 Tax=Fukomys damarensis TaxID=885580 RepID=A0A091D987_FUKDA|nr:hypothetical protein H920_11548 [Fukomys damarensis]